MRLEPQTTIKVSAKRPSEYLSEHFPPVGVLILQAISLNPFKQQMRDFQLARIIIESIPKLEHEVLEAPATSLMLNEIAEHLNFTYSQFNQHFVCEVVIYGTIK